MSDDERTPKCVLQLYNVSWLHHELCSKLFMTFHGDLSRSTLFGSYLHSLVVHAPLQFEIISLLTPCNRPTTHSGHSFCRKEPGLIKLIIDLPDSSKSTVLSVVS